MIPFRSKNNLKRFAYILVIFFGISVVVFSAIVTKVPGYAIIALTDFLNLGTIKFEAIQESVRALSAEPSIRIFPSWVQYLSMIFGFVISYLGSFKLLNPKSTIREIFHMTYWMTFKWSLNSLT